MKIIVVTVTYISWSNDFDLKLNNLMYENYSGHCDLYFMVQ